MPRVVAIHGIWQEYEASESMERHWREALSSSMRQAGACGSLDERDLALAHYGHRYRPEGAKGSAIPLIDELSPLHPAEAEAIIALWRESLRIEGRPDRSGSSDTKGALTELARIALLQLSGSQFFWDLFGGDPNLFLRGFLAQVARYLRDLDFKQEVWGDVNRLIGDDTKILIGHSLGSVVAYEIACERSRRGAHVPPVLVTLGSPLGIPKLVFDELTPTPIDGLGDWPAQVRRWVNVVDANDLVAVAKDLAPMFGAGELRIEDARVDNGNRPHDGIRYLTSSAVGRAVASELALV